MGLLAFLPPPARHIRPMANPPRPGKPARAKASRPDVQPLGEHLAALLNPVLNERPEPNRARPVPSSAQDAGHPFGISGYAATIESLKRLLESGDPHFVERPTWTPHRPPRPEKSEGGIPFKLVSEYEPQGDQPNAIVELVDGIRRNERDQVLLGVT
jgi:excinuclease ABC subunit B